MGGGPVDDRGALVPPRTADEVEARARLAALLDATPVPGDDLLGNLAFYNTRIPLARQLFLAELYQRILTVSGSIIELGVRWGQNLALFTNLRAIYEPYNHTRHVIGFDTFAGFPSVHEFDGPDAHPGGFDVSEHFVDHLSAVLTCHEDLAPISHIKKHELVVGDVIETVPAYLASHPETIVALAYFDLDLYEPTKAALEAIQPHLTKGSVLAFDELTHPSFPGEARAVAEVMGMGTFAIQRSPLASNVGFIVIE
jgi:hypothetical protein